MERVKNIEKNIIAKLSLNNKQFFIIAERPFNNAIIKVVYYFKDNLKLKKVVDDREMRNLDEIVNNLNKLRYIYCGIVTYEKEKFLWYINYYMPQSFFAKKNNGNMEICKYKNYKLLYDKYNLNPVIKYLGEKKNNFFKQFKPKAKTIKIAIGGALISVLVTSIGAWTLSQNNMQRTTKIQSEMNLDEKLNNSEIVYGANYNVLIQSIKENTNINNAEKEYIIQNFTGFFKQNSNYINEKGLVEILENLKIEYKYEPSSFTLGEYYTDSNKVIIYNGNNLEESLKNNNIVLAHEVFHALQNFGFNKISEGLTELLAREYTNYTNIENGQTESYKEGVIFAKMLCEVFPAEQIVQDSLKYNENPIPLVEYVMKKKNQDYESTVREISQLYDCINNSIAYLENDKFLIFYKNNNYDEETINNINTTFELLRKYDKELNQRNENKMLDIYEDMLMNTNKCGILDYPNEWIQSIDKQYFINKDTPITLKIRNSQGYLYEKKDNNGNVIDTIKLPEKNITLDREGNIIKEETPKQIYERFKEKLQEEIEER